MTFFIFDDFKRVRQVLKDYTFLFTLFNFNHVSRHLILSSSINIINLFSTESNCSSACVHCSITATYDCNLLTEIYRFISNHFTQKVYTADDAFCIFTRTTDPRGQPCTDSHKNRIKVLPNRFKWNINTNLCVRNHFNSHSCYK